MAFVTVENGKQVYFEDYGSGDAAIVLVHGWGMGLRVWDYCLPELLHAGLRVITLDHRCCGKSDKDFADCGIRAIAQDLVSIVELLQLTRVVLNGWSLGGAVATEAAALLGESCAGLVLTCAASPVYLQKPDFAHGGTDDHSVEPER